LASLNLPLPLEQEMLCHHCHQLCHLLQISRQEHQKQFVETELFKLESSATPEHLIPRQYVAHQFAPFCQLVQPVHSPNQVAVKQEASAFDRQEKSSVKQEKPRPSERDVQEPSRRRLATLTEPVAKILS